MKTKLTLLSIIFFSFFMIFNPALASSTSGYAWSENTGYIDFSEVTVESSVLSGYAYSPNVGWISMNCSNTSSCGTVDYKVSNKNGALSGYAWSENTGYLDFSKATISNTGVFSGYAYSPNIGWISLNCSNTSSCGTADYKVTTTYRKPQESSGSTPTVIVSFQGLQQTPITLPPTTSIAPNTPPSTSTPSTSPNITRTLWLTMTGDDVKALQVYLNTHGYILTTTGLGSPQNETSKFGLLTYKAVIKFQKDHNLTPDGVVGPITRTLLE